MNSSKVLFPLNQDKDMVKPAGNPLDLLHDESLIAAIASIVGSEHVACIEEAVIAFIYKRSFYNGRPPIPQMNKTFAKIRDHISALIELLNDAKTNEYLLGIAKEDFPDDGGEALICQRTPFINKTSELSALDGLRKLDQVCKASIVKQKSGPGKPKGQKDEALHYLLNSLCQCCEKANNGPLTTKQGNLLQCVVDVLYKPLSLGGNLPGLTKQTIKTRNKWCKQTKDQ